MRVRAASKRSGGISSNTGVRTAAGATALTVTPCGASSAASIFVSTTIPAFDAA